MWELFGSPLILSSRQKFRKWFNEQKATAEEQRVLWLEVGVALMYGKDKSNREEGQKFSDWVQEMFPGLRAQVASDALWFATNSHDCRGISDDATHPEVIRRLHNDQKATESLPEDAPEIKTVAAPKFATKRDAEKFIKVDLTGSLDGVSD